MADYWDTSCLLKLYCREADSEQFLDYLASRNEPLKTSSLTECELFYALIQKELRSETGGRSAQDLYDEFLQERNAGLIQPVPLGENILRMSLTAAHVCYGAQNPVPLRSLDGLHLASALHAGCGTLVTTDRRMQAAATLLGIPLAQI